MPADNQSEQQRSLQVAFFEGLQKESAHFLEKMSELWKQKLVLVGGVIGFLFVHEQVSAGPFRVWFALGIMGIALLLDLKHIEYACHARAISLYIRASLDKEMGHHSDYQRQIWGDEEQPGFRAWLWQNYLSWFSRTGSAEREDGLRRLVNWRFRLTSLTAGLPTLGIACFSIWLLFLSAGCVADDSWHNWYLGYAAAVLLTVLVLCSGSVYVQYFLLYKSDRSPGGVGAQRTEQPQEQQK